MTEFLKGTVTPKDWATAGGIAGAAVVLCVVFYFAIYGQQAQELQRITAQELKMQDALRVALDTKKNIDTLRAEAAKMQELVSQFEERLPESREIPTLLKQFEGFAGEIGLQVELSQLPPVTDARKQTIPYTVKARGSFKQIVSFINRLERFQRYLKVSDLDFGKEEDGVAEASFTLSTFRFIQANEGSQS